MKKRTRQTEAGEGDKKNERENRLRDASKQE